MAEVGETNLELSGLADDENLVIDFDEKIEKPVETPPQKNPGESSDKNIVNKLSDPDEQLEIVGLKKEESVADDGKTPDDKVEVQKNTTTSPSDDKMHQIYSSFAQHFKDAGVLSNIDLEENPIKSAEDFQNAIDKEVESRLNENQRAYKEAMDAGVAKDEFVNYNNQMQQLNSITEEDLSKEDSQKLRMQLIATDFINKGFDKDRALSYAQRSIETGKDVEDSKKALEDIKAFTKQSFEDIKNQKLESKNNSLKEIETFINSNDEIFKGLNIEKSDKEKLFKQISTPVAKSKTGNPINAYTKAFLENPTKMRVATEYLFYLTKGFSDFSKINQNISTKTTKSLDEILKSSSEIILGGIGDQSNKSNSSFLTDDYEIDV